MLLQRVSKVLAETENNSDMKSNISKIFYVMTILFSFSLILFNYFCSSNNDDNIREMDSEKIFKYYSTHSEYTNPGNYVYLYEGIPSDVSKIVKVVHGTILHLAQLEIDKIQIPKTRIDREIHFNTVENMLQQISKMDERPLICSRQIDDRMIGICTHFAMLTCSILRHKGIAARSRGGFETYHSQNAHHDHWICEYWNSAENRWIKIDPELNDFLKKRWNINFNNLNLSQDVFLTGVEVWKLCRLGKKNPNHFGIKGDKWFGGWDFVLNEMVLDYMALNKIELLPWDGNKLSEKGIDRLKENDFELLDRASALAIAENDSFTEMRTFYKNNKKLQK